MSSSFALMGVDGAVLRLAGARIADFAHSPQPHDRIVELRGDRVLPGLINAHDHLHLNHYPRTRFRERHGNAREWIEDIDSRRHTDPSLRECAARPRAAQLLQGGLKNLLSGVTTVAHHDPHYEPLQAADFPVRTLERYGWSHSLFIDGDAKVRATCEATDATQPWIIHAGEGVDTAARAEFERLEHLGCLRANTVLVHGVAFDRVQLHAMVSAGAALIWCPASNHFLFGASADAEALLPAGRIALGSDSRLSGSRDLLAELNLARHLASMDEARCTRLVTSDAAKILKLADRGELRAGALADLCVLPAGLALGDATRADVRAVVLGGEFRYGDEDYRDAFLAAGRTEKIRVDGCIKWLDGALVQRAAAFGIHEDGVEWP